MAIRKWYGAFVVGGLVGLVAAGCSSSDTITASDGGDAGVHRMLDASPGGGGDDAADSGAFDGTTGKAVHLGLRLRHGHRARNQHVQQRLRLHDHRT